MRWFLYTITMLVTGLLSAQSDLTADYNFFQDQSQLYQKWLDKSGFGEVIRVGEVEVEPHHLTLMLTFYTSVGGECWALWEQLQEDFERENALTLEQQLFYKLLHLMEVEQDQATIEVHNIIGEGRNFCFYSKIFFDAGAGRVEVRERYCKAQERNIEVAPNTLDGLKDMSFEEINRIYNRNSVFEAIFSYAKERYEKDKCELRYPQVREKERNQLLRFEVVDLCKEVLRDESNPWICKVLRRFDYQCNWIKREKLEFTITYERTQEGIRIGVKIDGKYGSGYYDQVKRGGYHDMDLDFDDYLVDYADVIANDFKKEVLKIGRNP